MGGHKLLLVGQSDDFLFLKPFDGQSDVRGDLVPRDYFRPPPYIIIMAFHLAC